MQNVWVGLMSPEVMSLPLPVRAAGTPDGPTGSSPPRRTRPRDTPASGNPAATKARRALGDDLAPTPAVPEALAVPAPGLLALLVER